MSEIGLMSPPAMGSWPAPLPLEACICGEHTDCPDGWHYGDDLPCSCTPDCALSDAADG